MHAEFDDIAENYDAELQKGLSISGESKYFFAEGRTKLLARRLCKAGFVPKSILDFGCGTGTSIPFLRNAFPNATITGAELSAKSIRIAAQSYRHTDVFFCLVDELPNNQRFDLVFCNGVFHHIPSDKRSASVQKIFNVLMSDGYFSLWENNPWNPGTRYVMKRIPFDRDAVPITANQCRKMLIREGFDVYLTDFAFYFPRQLLFLRFLERFLIRFPFGAQYQVLAKRKL